MAQAKKAAAGKATKAAVGQQTTVSTPIDSAPPATPSLNAQANYDAQVAATKAALEAEEKVQFLVPLALGEKPGTSEVVAINGYWFTIRKNSMVMIPVTIARILEAKYNIEATLGEQHRVDATPERANALKGN